MNIIQAIQESTLSSEAKALLTFCAENGEPISVDEHLLEFCAYLPNDADIDKVFSRLLAEADDIESFLNKFVMMGAI